MSRPELDAWCEAYGVTFESEPAPGQSFKLRLPATTEAFASLSGPGAPN